jgi:stearoyl-CoA desaturase (delta-9 desaturase)
VTVMLDCSTPDGRNGPEPMLLGEKTPAQLMLVKLFAFVPLVALVAAVPVVRGWGLGWVDIGLAVVFYALTCLGVTIGFHRYFTHGAFKARRGLRVVLAVVGSMAMQGPVVGWVADHRRHHAYADKEGDPGSPRICWPTTTSVGSIGCSRC